MLTLLPVVDVGTLEVDAGDAVYPVGVPVPVDARSTRTGSGVLNLPLSVGMPENSGANLFQCVLSDVLEADAKGEPSLLVDDFPVGAPVPVGARTGRTESDAPDLPLPVSAPENNDDVILPRVLSDVTKADAEEASTLLFDDFPVGAPDPVDARTTRTDGEAFGLPISASKPGSKDDVLSQRAPPSDAMEAGDKEASTLLFDDFPVGAPDPVDARSARTESDASDLPLSVSAPESKDDVTLPRVLSGVMKAGAEEASTLLFDDFPVGAPDPVDARTARTESDASDLPLSVSAPESKDDVTLPRVLSDVMKADAEESSSLLFDNFPVGAPDPVDARTARTESDASDLPLSVSASESKDDVLLPRVLSDVMKADAEEASSLLLSGDITPGVSVSERLPKTEDFHATPEQEQWRTSRGEYFAAPAPAKMSETPRVHSGDAPEAAFHEHQKLSGRTKVADVPADNLESHDGVSGKMVTANVTVQRTAAAFHPMERHERAEVETTVPERTGFTLPLHDRHTQVDGFILSPERGEAMPAKPLAVMASGTSVTEALQRYSSVEPPVHETVRLLKSDSQSIQIGIDPPGMNPVTISIQKQAQHLSVHFVTETATDHQMLSAHGDMVRLLLENQGLADGRFPPGNVEVSVERAETMNADQQKNDERPAQDSPPPEPLPGADVEDVESSALSVQVTSLSSKLVDLFA